MKIALLGDIGLFGKYTLDNPDIKEYFKEVSDFLKTMDATVGNLEVPLCITDKPKKGKSASIRAHPANAELLTLLNVTHVSLANNHIFDYGNKGYTETVETLKKYKIKHFGTENQVSLIESENNKIALSGFTCYSTNALGYQENKKVGINELDFDKVKKCLISNDENGYFNIASFHIGEEHINYPNSNHIELARKLSDTLSYVFYGHHPHVLQGIEEYNQSLHLYSLGNFCFDDVYTSKSKEPLVKQQKMNKESAIIVLNIENSKLINYKVVPIFDNGKKISFPKDDSLKKKIDKYSSYLKLNKSEFKNIRAQELNNYINNRKNSRDFEWYLKRLNLNSLLMIKNSKSNYKKYKKVLLEKL